MGLVGNRKDEPFCSFGLYLKLFSVNIGKSSDNPAFSTNKMCKMLAENDVTAIIGPYTSSQVKACSYLAGEVNRILYGKVFLETVV